MAASAKYLELTDAASEKRNVGSLRKMSSTSSLVSASQTHPFVPLEKRNSLEFSLIVAGGTILAFNAGFVNGTTLQMGSIPVSHVTGTTTLAGIMLGKGQWDDFLLHVLLVVCFMIGSGATVLLLPRKTLDVELEYGPLFFFGALLFLAADFAKFQFPDTPAYFCFASLACGLQNGMTTRYSGNVIRSTHLTGLATDVGLILAYLFIGEHKDVWKLWIMLPMLCSFFGGAVTSVFTVYHYKAWSFLCNTVLFLVCGILYAVLVAKHHQVPFWRAFLGRYPFGDAGGGCLQRMGPHTYSHSLLIAADTTADSENNYGAVSQDGSERR